MSRIIAVLKRLATLEPVMLISVFTAIVLFAAVWGFDLAALGDKLGQSVTILIPVIVLVAGWWTRSAVTPAARVVETVAPDGTRIAGPASPLPTGSVIPAD